MSQSEKAEFNFRYRPKADSPDGLLVRYLNSHDRKTRRTMILKALRAFYAMPAWGYFGEVRSFEEFQEFVQYFQEVYDNHYDTRESIAVRIDAYLSLENSGGIDTISVSDSEGTWPKTEDEE
ncbi:MAG: hypothetical protein AAFR58_18500 [Cyanobacteria bacterium J06627_28]